MKILSKSLFVKMCVIGIGILLIRGAMASAAEKPECREYVNVRPAFSITVPLWGEIEKNDIDYLALGLGMMKMPQIVVSEAGYFTNSSTAESLARAMIVILKDRYSGTDFIITYSKEIKMADGTPAYEAGLKWNVPMFSIDSTCVWIRKGDTKISVIISDMMEIKDSLKSYMYTLSIK